jgi:myosin heavy subunit
MFLDRPVGLLALLDEESHFPNASDETLAAKLAMHFKDHPSFTPPQVGVSVI